MARVKLSDGRIVQSDAIPRKVAGVNPAKRRKPCSKSKRRHSSSNSESRDGRKWGASHRGGTLNQWNVSNMDEAIREWSTQKDKSVREVARAWCVPYATFRRRIVATSIERRADYLSGRPTILSQSVEKELADHIQKLASAGFPCSRSDVKNLAYEYAVKNGIKGFSMQKSTAGYYWFRGFLRRHSELVIKKAENLAVPRAMAMNKQQVSNWFETYRLLAVELGIIDLPSHLWNTDETGLQNIHTANNIVGVVGKPSYNVTAMEKGETSTALVTISAVGTAAPVMIVHKGKNIGKQWSNGAPRDAVVRVSEKGYINKELFFEFSKLFIKFLKEKHLFDGRPHLLLLDSHYSHLYNLDFLTLMKANNVHVFAIPPHTSHWLQPLDRGVFGSLKSAWQHEMKLYTRQTAGRKLDKKDFFLVFSPAYSKAVTVENCQGAFRGTGIFPFHPEAIPTHAYDPSSTSEREHVSQTEAGNQLPAEVLSSGCLTEPTADAAAETQSAGTLYPYVPIFIMHVLTI